MAFVTDLIKQAFTTNPDGDVALRTTIEGDQNLNGGYISNEQTTTNMMSKGTVYRFDGVDDIITVTDSAEIQDIFSGGGLVGFKGTIASDGEADNGYLVAKLPTGAAEGWLLRCDTEVSGYIPLVFAGVMTTTSGIWTTQPIVKLGVDVDIKVVWDSDTPTVKPIIYVNGSPVDVTESQAPVGTYISDAGTNLYFGSDQSTNRASECTLAEVMLGAYAPTAAQIKALVSGNIPYSDQWSNIVGYWGQDSISETHWYDKANGNDGAVTGAEVLNQPQGMAFMGIVLTPQTQPSNPSEGMVIYNSATNKINMWNGSAWEVVTSV